MADGKTAFVELPSAAYAIAPGLLVCVVIALASGFVAERYGGPTMLYALLLGIAMNFLVHEPRCARGVDVAATAVLRLGVALLGIRITADHLLGLGSGPILMVVAAVLLTIGSGWLLSRVLGLRWEFGLLTGGAVAICGASAALALSAVLPRDQHSERNTILTIIGVTALSTVAMVAYPLITQAFPFPDAVAGIFIGGTIHDVAQAVGAGYMISAEAGDSATLVKLLRVSMLVPVVLAFSLLFRGRRGEPAANRPPLLPAFLVAFVALAAINSLGWVSNGMREGVSELSRACLVTAIAALGIKTSFQALTVVGWRPILMMVLQTLFLAGFVLMVLLFARGYAGGAA